MTPEVFVRYFCPVDYTNNNIIYFGHLNEFIIDHFVIWTQIGDDGESTCNPAVDIHVYENKIKINSGEEKFDKEFPFPKDKKEFNKIEKEINEVLTEYYGQWTEQPRFVRKGE